MQRHTDGQLVWLTFDLFSEYPQLVHGIFLRHGGVSFGEFGSLNFSTFQGDSSHNVATNRKRALEALGITTVCELWQHHGKTVVQANPNHSQKGDALTTNLADLGLMILHADCQVALFYDPVQHALALTHCGWRGNVHNIYQETILSMISWYGSKPENILVGISPSLSPGAAEFINYRQELPHSFHFFQHKPFYFDFWAISRWQLQACGILPHHIEIASICTYSNPNDFFSYRRCKASGRHATLALLKI